MKKSKKNLAQLDRRLKAYDATQAYVKRPSTPAGMSEHHKPGSQNGRKGMPKGSKIH